jgi:hypothetical protein
MTKNQFRILLLATLAVGLLGGVVEFSTHDSLPQALQDYLNSTSEEESNDNWMALGVFALILIVAVIAAYIGLFLFKPWSRPLNLLLWPAAFVFTPMLGPTVTSGWATACYELSAGLGGMIVALTYFSRLSKEFQSGKR